VVPISHILNAIYCNSNESLGLLLVAIWGYSSKFIILTSPKISKYVAIGK
jgi:hypothetical protein